MEMETTGAGNSMLVSCMGWSLSQMVSPVRVWARPTTATMSLGGLELHGMVGVHAQDAADALLLADGAVPDVLAGDEGAGVDADVGEFAGVLVGDDLEGEGAEGGFVGGFAALGLGAFFGLFGDDGRDFVGRGQEADDAVEELLDAFVLEGAAAVDGDDLAGDGRLAQDGAHLVGGEGAGGEEFFHERVVLLGALLDEVFAPLLRLFEAVGGDVLDADVGVVAFAVVDGLHVDQVDDAAEAVLLADRDHDGYGVAVQLGADFFEHAVEVGAGAVHLVDEGDLGDFVLLGLVPDFLRLRLHAAHRAEERDGAVQDAQAALDLDREVDVSGGVDEGDVVAFPLEGRGGGLDGDAALALLYHEVHGGLAVVDLAELVGLAGVEEDALGHGGLAGIDVRHDADVADLGNGDFSGHGICSSPGLSPDKTGAHHGRNGP